MARIRTIKPEFWTDEKVVELSAWARLLFIGLWNFADDSGRMVASAKRIKMQILPADDVDIRLVLDELRRIGLINLYLVDGLEYLEIPQFLKHQKIDKRTPSKLPENNKAFAEPSPNPPDGMEGKGMEGKETTPATSTRTTEPEPPPAGVVPQDVDPQVVATVEQLRVTPGVGTARHAKAGEFHGLLTANSVRCSASHPLLVDWAQEGVTTEQLTRAIQEARKSNAGQLSPAYLQPILDRVRNGTIDPIKPQPAPISSSHSTSKATQAIEEIRKAKDSAVPPPEAIRAFLARRKPQDESIQPPNPQGQGEDPIPF